MKRSAHDRKIVFWGTSLFSVGILDTLKERGFLPSLIVTSPDKPKGRKLLLAPPPVKIWAEENSIPFLQPEKLDDALASELRIAEYELFIVASYGKILPRHILDIPKRGTLNVHPSLLPKLRGASPIQTTILLDENPGVTIMLLDEQMDHGPIVAQKEISITPWPPKASVLEAVLAREGGNLLSETIPEWVEGLIKPQEQAHTEATYTKKFTKEDGLIDLAGAPAENLKKIRAFDVWPRAYFFAEQSEKKIRVVVTDAEVADGALLVRKVIPEGGKEMNYEDFARNAELGKRE